MPPAIHHHFSVEPIGEKVVRDEDYTIYPAHAMLYIAATDVHAGTRGIEYTINGGAIMTSNPLRNLSPGNYLIEVAAYDVLGNKHAEEIKFSIEK